MTDTNTDSAAPAAKSQPRATTSTNPNATPATSKRNKNRLRRKARRRDGADSEEDEPSEDNDASSGSAKPKPAPSSAPPKPATSKLKPLFPDVSSTTPAAWADMDDVGDEITFAEFNRSEPAPVRGRGGASARGGRGRGGKPVAREPRELSDEQKRREEEKAALKREKAKAKRKAKKEAERAVKAGAKAAPATSSTPAPASAETSPPAPSSAPAPASPAKADAVDSSLAASTSALTLDEPPAAESSSTSTPATATASVPAGAGAPRGAPRNRVAYTQRVAEDPKFTPRVGNFWMHDQRHYEAGTVGEGSFGGLRGMSDYWRGRGGMRGMPRGGFRGAPPPRGRGRGRGFGFVPPVRHMSPGASSQHSASPSVSSSVQGPPSAPSPTTATQNGHRMAEMDKLEMQLSKKRAQHNATSEGKWGHEGFEEMAAHDVDPRLANRLLRGRGRGRGGFARGGPPFRPSIAHLPTPEASPDRSATKPETTTQPTVDTLLEDSGSVTVKLPGGAKSVDVDRPPSQPTEPDVQGNSSPSPFPLAFTPSNPSPVPYVGSDSGSMSSGYMPPGPMHAMHTGEFYHPNPGAPPFHPPGQFFAPNPNYQPQSFTPEPVFQHQSRGSFSGQGAQSFYPAQPAAHNRPGSPLNPYGGMSQGFFVPPRPNQKVAIRSPTLANGEETKSPITASDLDATEPHPNPSATTTPDFVPPFYPQYNPYAADGAVYYPPQGYWPQQYEGEYGYVGDVQYPGY